MLARVELLQPNIITPETTRAASCSTSCARKRVVQRTAIAPLTPMSLGYTPNPSRYDVGCSRGGRC